MEKTEIILKKKNRVRPTAAGRIIIDICSAALLVAMGGLYVIARILGASYGGIKKILLACTVAAAVFAAVNEITDRLRRLKV